MCLNEYAGVVIASFVSFGHLLARFLSHKPVDGVYCVCL